MLTKSARINDSREFEEEIEGEVATIGATERSTEIGSVPRSTNEDENDGKELAQLRAELAALRSDVDSAKHFIAVLTNSRPARLLAQYQRIRRVAGRVGRILRHKTVAFDVRPGAQVSEQPDVSFGFVSEGDDPQLSLVPREGHFPSGWVQIDMVVAGEAVGSPKLYFDCGQGFSEGATILLPHAVDGQVSLFQHFPGGLRQLRLDPGSRPGSFVTRDVSVREVAAAEIALRLGLREIRHHGRSPKALMGRAAQAAQRLKSQGMSGLIRSAVSPRGDYASWVREFDTLTDADRKRITAHIGCLTTRPVISVVMPVYNVDERWLREAIESVRAQLYPHWELCIADDKSSKRHVRRVLEKYAALDPRIKVAFRDENGHIAAASNTALENASGDYVALLDHDDVLPEHALYAVVEKINAYPEAALLYSDEDKITATGVRHDPYFKPDWSPDLFYSQNMVSHLGVYRRDVLEQIGGFRLGTEGSQDYDLALRTIERLRPEQILHIPQVLYHWRSIEGSTALASDAKNYAHTNSRKALAAHLERLGKHADVMPAWEGSMYHRVRYRLPARPPVATIIIPTRDRVDLLRRCVESIANNTAYETYEVIVMDNDSQERQALSYLKEIRQHRNVRVISYPGAFNFAEINNEGAALANGDVLVFLNNDTEVIEPDWLRELVSHAMRDEIGAVGAMLYYPTDHVQHAGVVLGMGGIAGHAHKHMGRGHPGYMGRGRLIQNFSAITAACLAIRKGVFEAVGGFETQLAVAFNDVDLCLRVKQQGYRNLWTPYAELYHYESVSRGNDFDADKRDRFMAEIRFMEKRWGNALLTDPCYNANLSLEREDFAPAFPPRIQRPWESLA